MHFKNVEVIQEFDEEIQHTKHRTIFGPDFEPHRYTFYYENHPFDASFEDERELGARIWGDRRVIEACGK